MRDFLIEERLEKILNKLFKKDRSVYEATIKKMDEILKNRKVEHYKNLRRPLQYLKRVHVRGPFVLVFKYVKSEDKIIFYDFDHHDNIYNK